MNLLRSNFKFFIALSFSAFSIFALYQCNKNDEFNSEKMSTNTGEPQLSGGCIDRIGYYDNPTAEAILTYDYATIESHFSAELGMQIDTVKIVTDIGNDIHWLVGIGNDGTALSPLAVELELDSADNYQIAGASGGGGGGVTTTHSCVGNPCGSCAFKFAAGDISGCTCLEGGEEKQCNHTVTQTSGGIIFQINQDYCPAE